MWLQVEPFLLVPRLSGENERERRKELLRRRNEHIQLTGGPMGVCLCILSAFAKVVQMSMPR